MGKRVKLLLIPLVGLLGGEVRAVLPPEHMEAEKADADWQVTVQLKSVDLVERSTTGGLDQGLASGRVLAVTRAPENASSLSPGDSLAFRVPVWAWSDRRLEPPGPDRLYWGTDAVLDRLEVWGAFRDREFVVSVFETLAPANADSGSADATLDRIDRIAAAFVDSPPGELTANLESLAGLRFRSANTESQSDSDPGHLLADHPAPDGWALSGEIRMAGDVHLLVMTLGDSNCVRRSHVTKRHGADAQPIPVPPTRTLPAPWHLKYSRPWGSILFGFRMAEPHDYDDCLVEILIRKERASH